jgi:hypothetical protein
MNEYLFTWLAMDGKGKINMQEIVPVCNIDKVNVHYKNPNLYRRKQQGKIHTLNDAEIEALK